MQLRATVFVVYNVLYVFVVFSFSVLFCWAGSGEKRSREGGERERQRERERMVGERGAFNFKSVLKYDRFSRVRTSFRCIY